MQAIGEFEDTDFIVWQLGQTPANEVCISPLLRCILVGVDVCVRMCVGLNMCVCMPGLSSPVNNARGLSACCLGHAGS
jgi:hypothetical protein